MNLNWVLIFIPIAFGLDWFGANPIIVFLASEAAIIPLASLMEQATKPWHTTWDRPTAAC